MNIWTYSTHYSQEAGQLFSKLQHLAGIRIFLFFFFLFFCIFVFFALAAPQRPTCSYHANPAGSPTRNDMSLQVGLGEMPDLNPGLLFSQSGALPLSHHIPKTMFCFEYFRGVHILQHIRGSHTQLWGCPLRIQINSATFFLYILIDAFCFNK